MNLLILSLLMAFGGHGHPQCSVLLSGPMKISGVDIQNLCIGPGMDVTALSPEEGTVLLYVNALGEHVKCLHTECLNVPVPKPYPLWRMEAQKHISRKLSTIDPWVCWDNKWVLYSRVRGRKQTGYMCPGELPDGP